MEARSAGHVVSFARDMGARYIVDREDVLESQFFGCSSDTDPKALERVFSYRGSAQDWVIYRWNTVGE
jgi:hypothetical protein